MIPVPGGVRVWLATGVTDMRRGMNTLSLQVQEGLGREPLRTPEGLANDPVMGLDNGIGDGAAPLHGTDGEDGEPPVPRNIAQPVREVAFPLAAKAGDTVRGNGLQEIGGQIEALQEFQAIEKTVDVGRVPAHLEPAQPDEPAHAAVDFLGQQPVETEAHVIVQARGNARLYPALCGNERVRAKTLHDRQSRQDHLPAPALLHEPPRQPLIRARRFRLVLEPDLQVPGAMPREHPVAVDKPDVCEVFPPGLFPHRIAIEVFGPHAELSGNEAEDVQGNDLPRHQQPPRISKGAELEREAQPVVPRRRTRICSMSSSDSV